MKYIFLTVAIFLVTEIDTYARQLKKKNQFIDDYIYYEISDTVPLPKDTLLNIALVNLAGYLITYEYAGYYTENKLYWQDLDEKLKLFTEKLLKDDNRWLLRITGGASGCPAPHSLKANYFGSSWTEVNVCVSCIQDTSGFRRLIGIFNNIMLQSLQIKFP